MNRRDLEQLIDERVALNAVRAAAPYVRVTLRGDRGGPTVRGRAKLDTGAENTYFAPSVVRKLGLRKRGSATAHGLGGDGRKVSTYAGKLQIAGLPSTSVGEVRGGYAALDRRGDVALIGRKAMADAGLRLEYDAATGESVVRPSRVRRSGG